MPIVMESSMFCYGIGKLISNHTSVGFNLAKVYVSDLLIMETIRSKSLTCVSQKKRAVSAPEIKNRHCLWRCGYTLP